MPCSCQVNADHTPRLDTRAIEQTYAALLRLQSPLIVAALMNAVDALLRKLQVCASPRAHLSGPCLRSSLLQSQRGVHVCVRSQAAAARAIGSVRRAAVV